MKFITVEDADTLEEFLDSAIKAWRKQRAKDAMEIIKGNAIAKGVKRLGKL